jgi:hypothetical protein
MAVDNTDAVITDLKKYIPNYSKNHDWQKRNLYGSGVDFGSGVKLDLLYRQPATSFVY